MCDKQGFKVWINSKNGYLCNVYLSLSTLVEK